MNSINEWIETELYPTLYDYVPDVFPEHNFVQGRKGWQSKTYLNGEQHKTRKDKTKINAAAPYLIFEEGGSSKGIINYIMERDGIEFMAAIQKLARIANLPIPESNSNITQYLSKTSLREQAQEYFTYCLWNGGVEEVSYLKNRGYTDEQIQAMEVGRIPSLSKTIERLTANGHTEEEVKAALAIENKAIGKTHTLTIPFRAGGRLKGFKFRTIGDASPKYLNSSGLDKSTDLFNSNIRRGISRLIIVEGELDALFAECSGINNVVALAGKTISRDAVSRLISRGIGNVIICLDGGKETKEEIRKCTQAFLREGYNNILIASLPEGTDPDQLIITEGVECLSQIIDTARHYWEWGMLDIIEKHTHDNKNLTPEQENILITDLLTYSGKIPKEDSDRLTTRFCQLDPISELGLKSSSLQDVVDRLRKQNELKKQKKELQSIARQFNKTIDDGKLDNAKNGVLEAIHTLKGKAAQFTLKPGSWQNDIANIDVNNLYTKSGIKSLDDSISFKNGGLSYIAGRPGQGKTSLMLNMFWHMARAYPNKRFYFFNYEETFFNLTSVIISQIANVPVSSQYTDRNRQAVRHYIANNETGNPELNNAIDEVKQLLLAGRLNIFDQSPDIETLTDYINTINKNDSVGAVFVDYVQRVGAEYKAPDMRMKVAHVSNSLLHCAKTNNIPLIVGAQLNRTEDNKSKPSLSSLKEASNIEEDANLVLAVRKSENAPEMEVYVLKNRDGDTPSDRIQLLWNLSTGFIR